MVFIKVFKNKILIDSNKLYSVSYYLNRCIGLQYTYYGVRSLFNSLSYYKNGYQCTIGFYDFYYQIFKNKLYVKRRRLNIININYIIIYYSYFIYIKYYSISKIKEYINITNSITYKKLFNCRDYYKIYSYI